MDSCSLYIYYNCNPGGHSGESLINDMTDSVEEAQYKYDILRTIFLKQKNGTTISDEVSKQSNSILKFPKTVSTGGYRTLLVCEDDSLWTWGMYCAAQIHDDVIVNY